MKRICAFLLLLGLLAGTPDQVWSKGGRSYGGGSSARSSSPARSYGGGSSVRSSTPAPTRSYGGGSSTPRVTTPTTPRVSYGGGSTSTSKTTTPAATPSRSYGGGSSSSSSSSSSTSSTRPAAKPFNTVAAKEQMKVETRRSYTASSTPRTEYTTSAGKTAKIDPKDRRIERLQTQLDHERWVNREQRQQTFFGSYYSRPIVVYNDPYPSFFWWWMLDRSLDQRAMWAYHHRPMSDGTGMDQARYQAMLSKDANLEARIKALEAKGIPVDRSYTPEGMDPDLQYTNDFVDAAYNPVPTQVSHGGGGGGGFWRGLWTFIKWVFIILCVCLMIYTVWYIAIRKLP